MQRHMPKIELEGLDTTRPGLNISLHYIRILCWRALRWVIKKFKGVPLEITNGKQNEVADIVGSQYFYNRFEYVNHGPCVFNLAISYCSRG